MRTLSPGSAQVASGRSPSAVAPMAKRRTRSSGWRGVSIRGRLEDHRALDGEIGQTARRLDGDRAPGRIAARSHDAGSVERPAVIRALDRGRGLGRQRRRVAGLQARGQAENDLRARRDEPDRRIRLSQPPQPRAREHQKIRLPPHWSARAR